MQDLVLVLPRTRFLGGSCIKKPGSYKSGPGSLRIGYRLSAVFVHEGYARALVGEAEILPAAFLALFLRRWRGLRHGVADDRRAGGGSDGRGAAGRHQVGAAASATPWRTHPIAGGKVATPAAAEQAAAATAADEVAG